MGAKFKKACGRSDCCATTNICDHVAFGWGGLDDNGFWEFGCAKCARAYEKQTGKTAWPYTQDTISKILVPVTDGLHTCRLSREPEEKAFAVKWHSFAKDNLAYLLCTDDQRFASEPSFRDRQVAAAVIQWLGSSVGQFFLTELGYKKQ